jgi:putative ABC transport system permease protein
MIGGVAAAFVVLWALGLGLAALAGRARGAARGAARLGLANLTGPGSAARTAAPAIGLGVALLAAVVLIQSSLLREIADIARAPRRPWCSPRSPATGVRRSTQWWPGPSAGR